MRVVGCSFGEWVLGKVHSPRDLRLAGFRTFQLSPVEFVKDWLYSPRVRVNHDNVMEELALEGGSDTADREESKLNEVEVHAILDKGLEDFFEDQLNWVVHIPLAPCCTQPLTLRLCSSKSSNKSRPSWQRKLRTRNRKRNQNQWKSRNKSSLITPCLPFDVILSLSLVFAHTPSLTLPVSRLPQFPC